MTREQIEAMPPGRELDALVEKTVFGVNIDRHFSSCPIAHAALWDKLIADGWSVELSTRQLTTYQYLIARAEIWKPREKRAAVIGFSQTRYHALAKAALMAYTEPR